MEFTDGARVRHTGDGSLGTVHLFPNLGPRYATGEVRWDNSFIADELDFVADKLELVR